MIDISGHLRPIRKEVGFLDTTDELIVNCCGYQKFMTKNFSRLREKGRLDFQLIYIINGSGEFLVDHKTHRISAGSIIVYPPNIKQYYVYSSVDQPEVYWVHFTGSSVHDLLSKMNFLNSQVLSIGIQDSCIHLYKEMIYELQLKRTHYKELTKSYLIQLLATISRMQNETNLQKSNPKFEALQKVIEQMHRSYHQQWSVEKFSKLCNLSEYHFIHLFKELTGMPPIQYLTSIRIDKAKELLINSSLNIAEISSIVGYENSLYFSRIFKKSTGYCPTIYRNSEINK